MQTITREYAVYEYSELSNQAKGKAREKFIEGRCSESTLFEDDLKNKIDYLFPDSELKCQYSLSYSQGDGLNIYGKLRLYDILPYLDFTEKERRALSYYITNGCDYAYLPCNNRYCYCIVDRADYTAEMLDALERGQIRDINRELIGRFETACIDYLSNLCGELEKQGYRFFYEPEQADIEAWADACELLFLESGEIFE